jgi:hypothetical protein
MHTSDFSASKNDNPECPLIWQMNRRYRVLE